MADTLTTARIPNDKLREFFLKSGLSAHDVAALAGWFRPKANKRGVKVIQPDQEKVSVCLGLKETTCVRPSGKRDRSKRQTIRECDALAIGRALNLDPFEYGL